MDELAAVLGSLGLERYAEAFRAADVDLRLLPLLTEEDLKEVGLSLGHRRKLRVAIENGLLTPPSEAEAAPASAAPQHSGEPQRRQVTVMFCDLVGSVDLTQRMDPEEMGRLLRRFQDGAAGAISRFDGFVDRFMGDGLLAFFGYPRAHEDAAERAVRAALAVVELVGGMATPAGDAIAVRVAIASGPAYFGEIVEHGGAREPIVTGEVVNLAARLQAIAPLNSVVIAPPTRRLLRDLFELVDLGPHEFKGIGRPVQVWRVVREQLAGTRFEAAHSHCLPPIVGREAEISLLKERWHSACAGEGQVVLLSGEAGMGKSRIAQELRDHIACGPHVVVRHQCSPFHRNSALYPSIAHLRHAAGLGLASSAAEKLDRLQATMRKSGVVDSQAVALLAGLLAIPLDDRLPALDLAPEARKHRTLQALVDQLLGLASHAPVLFLVEDVHWIDPTTQELLSQAIGQLQRSAVLMLATYRPEFRPEWANFSHVTTLVLSGLPRRQSAALIEHATGSKRLPPELVEQILSKTDGIPLFIEELAKAIMELGLLREHGGGLELVNSVASLSIPDTLHDSLLARIERHPSVKELAQIGAVIGREFAFAHLSALAGVKGEALDTGIRELLRAGLVHERGPSRSTYVFKHALIQDAAYSTLVIARRQQLHAQCAEIFQQLSPEIAELQPELLAHHYTEAGKSELAARFWLQAARRAAERSANLEAIAHVRQGIRATAGIEDEACRTELELALQLEQSVPLIATRGYAAEETCAAWERARVLAEQRGDQRRLVRALYGLGAARSSAGETRAAVEISDEIAETGRRLADDGLELVGYRLRGLNVHLLGDQDAARRALEAALAMYDPDRHGGLRLSFGHDARLAAAAVLSTVRWLQGYPETARRMSLANIERAEALRHANSLAYALAYGACLVALLRGDETETMRLADQLLGLADKYHLLLWKAYAEAYKGWALTRAGAAAEGILLLESGMAGLRRARSGAYQPLMLGLLGYGLGRAGRAADSVRLLGEAVAEAERREEMWCMPELLRLQAGHARRRGSLDQASDLLDRAMSVARQCRLRSWELRVGVDIAALRWRSGRADEARELLRDALGVVGEAEATPDRRRAEALLERGDAVITFRGRAGRP